MLCEKCGKRNATVTYTQIINGQKSSINICSQCAAGESIFDNFGSLLSFGTREKTVTNTICPLCKMSLAEFTRKGRMGCGKCYETFRPYAKNMLQKIHGTAKHTVDAPPKEEVKKEEKAPKSKEEILREKLAKAIAEENFEEAAILRDKIREISAQTGKDGDKI